MKVGKIHEDLKEYHAGTFDGLVMLEPSEASVKALVESVVRNYDSTGEKHVVGADRSSYQMAKKIAYKHLVKMGRLELWKNGTIQILKEVSC